jgi:hypothetical protein
MALSKIDVANMLTGATPVANGGTALTSGFVNGADPRPLSKPLIINGNMAVAQRGTSFTSVGDGVYTLDRFETNKVMDAVATITQETLTSGNAYLNGFKNAFKVDVTTADTTLTGTQRLLIQHAIEGQNLQALKFGTANAEKLTLAFWVKATKTGTNIVRLYAPDDNRAVSASYTVSSSDTWEHKVLNFPADTTGVIDNDNGNGLSIAWCIGAGADFQSGTLATTWGTQTAANDFVGQVNNLDSTSNNFHLTGVQLEVGEFSSTTLPPFQHESFGDNLQRCLRYYYRANGRCGFGAGTGFVQDGAVKAYIYHTMPVAPRTEMSFSLSGTSSAIITIDGNASDDVQSISSIHADSFPFKDYEFNFVTNGSSVTDKAGMGIRINASNYIECDAEL